ncbi:MAG: hypothetical protein WAK16_02635 [Candidatus Cybelea sp.]|jgi:hypothetical protein
MHAHPFEARMAHVEGAFDQVNERLGSIDRRLDGLDVRFNWVIGTLAGAWVTMISAQIATMLTILFHR